MLTRHIFSAMRMKHDDIKSHKTLKGQFIMKKLFSISLLFLAPLLYGYDFVIPAAGTGAGAAGSVWKSEVTLHNSGNLPLEATLAYRDGLSAAPFTVSLAPGATESIDDIVATTFGRSASTGAITVDTSDASAGKLAITSRTYTLSAAGEFGQDVPAVPVSDALEVGDHGVLPGPSRIADRRFNFGIFAIDASVIEWQLVRKDGSLAATVSRNYAAGVHVQYSRGVETLFAKDSQDNDVVRAVVQSGRAVVYGSIIHNATNDPTYVPFSRTRPNLLARITGIDLDENGTVDVSDANGDGVLDQTLELEAGRFPNYFRVLAGDPEGAALAFALIDAPADVRMIEPKGTVQWFPGADLRGTTATLKVSVSDGIDSTVLIIPVRFV